MFMSRLKLAIVSVILLSLVGFTLWMSYKNLNLKLENLEAINDQLVTNQILLQSSLDVNNTRMLSLIESQRTILEENNRRTRRLQELINEDKTVKDYLGTPVPESLTELYFPKGDKQPNSGDPTISITNSPQ